jgi:heme exporter protein CcmD
MLGKYTVYIVPAYAISAAVILGLVVWTRGQYRRRLKEIETLEKQGVRRRSAPKAGNG